MNRNLLPALAALALVIAGPARERFEVSHGPKLIVLLVLAAALMWKGRVPLGRWGANEWLVLCVLAVAVVSGLLADSPALAIAPLVLGAGAVAIVLSVSTQGDRDLWLLWTSVAVVIVAGIGLLEMAGLVELAPHGRAPSSTMGQRNALAHFLLLGSPIIWSRALGSRRWLIAVALIGAVVVGSRTRAVWVVGPPLLVVFALLTRRLAVLKPIGFAAVGVVAGVLAPIVLRWRQANPYADTLSRLVEWRSGSGWSRLVEWTASIALWKSDPLFGIGPGNWFLGYGLQHGGSRFPHSDHVALLVERGLVGALLWIALAIAVGGRSRDPVVLCTILAAAALGALDSVMQLPAPLLLVTIVAFAGARIEVAPLRSPVASAALAGLAVWASLAFASRLLSTAESTPFERLELAATLDPLDGEVRVTLAEAWASAGDCVKARRHLDAAQWLLPSHPELKAIEARCPPP